MLLLFSQRVKPFAQYNTNGAEHDEQQKKIGFIILQGVGWVGCKSKAKMPE
jgi:hypothetical protein